MSDELKKTDLPETRGEHGPVKPFMEHLEDLRWVLIKIISAVTVSLILCFSFLPRILLFLEYPLERSGVLKEMGNPAASDFLKVFSPSEAFTLSFQLALYAGLIIASPFVVYILAAYILPVLTRKERGLVMPVFWAGTFLFLCGVFFCYFFILPAALAVSIRFANMLHLSVSFWTVESYVSFVTKFMIGMGLGFEMPLVILILVQMGILDYAKLSAARRYVIVLNFILGAVLTTPEVFTQIIMAVPLCMLYEACVWIAWWKERRKRRESC